MPLDEIQIEGSFKLIRRGAARSVQRLHFTGGLQGHREALGWCVGPLRRNKRPEFIEAIPEGHLGQLAKDIGARLVGVEQITTTEGEIAASFWTPLLGAPKLQYAPDITWGMVASAAHRNEDLEYFALARSICSCLRASGLQLRNISNYYCKQLCLSLNRGDEPNHWFSNTSLNDLHISFHSLLAEMGSTRDYLAVVAARRVGAPDRIEALNRLLDWVSKDVNAGTKTDVLIERLLNDCAESNLEPWLNDIGVYRNRFLHRESMSANEMSDRLVLRKVDSRFGPILQISMEISSSRNSEISCDAFLYFSYLYARLCRLADFFAKHAKYPALIPKFRFS